MSDDRIPLLIVGNSEIAAMAYEYFTHDSTYRVVAFAIGAEYIKEELFCGLPVVPLDGVEATYPPSQHQAFVAIGDGRLNRVRAGLVGVMRDKGYRLASYVSSAAFVWRNVKIGENCFILENNVLQPFVEIGDNVTLWSGNHIGHRTVIEDHVFVASHVVISGFCRIGRYSFLGVNVAVAHQVAIGEDNFIAMSAAVARSTSPDEVHQGVPSKPREISAKRFCRVGPE